MASLRQYIAGLRTEGRGTVPDLDPLDGGTAAKALFLFEKPGPMTEPERSGRRAGSGFISRDNDDETAEATYLFMREAGLPRRLTAIWNVVPWWNGTRKVTAAELRDGVGAVRQLVTLLPNLRVVVLVGNKAARATSMLEEKNLRVVLSAHPSPVVRASRPSLWMAIPHQWASIKPLLNGEV